MTEIISDIEILNYALEKGMINKDTVLNDIEAMERKEILSKHPCKITITNYKNGKHVFATYLPLEDGTRLFRRRNSQKELEDVIIAFYREQQERIYLTNVFEEWINQKLEYGEIQKASYDRYRNDFKRFFNTNDTIMRKQFKNITTEDLEAFIKNSIHNLALTRKCYGGLRTLLRGIFKYGKKKHYTTISITEFFGDLELPKNIFQKKYIEKQKEIFLENEIPMVIKFLRENPDIFNLGILLTFQTGMRVGELSSLMPQDITESNMIKIRRTEVKFKDEYGKWTVSVKDHAKTDAGHRDLIIPETAKETLKMILNLNPNGTYLFENKGKRIRGNTFNKRLSNICDKLCIPHRTMHKIRKTYGTQLIDNNVDEKFILEQMGHEDISTTKKLYYFSNKTTQSKQKQIENAIIF